MIYHFFLIKTRITAVSGTLIDCFGPFYESDDYNNKFQILRNMSRTCFYRLKYLSIIGNHKCGMMIYRPYHHALLCSAQLLFDFQFAFVFVKTIPRNSEQSNAVHIRKCTAEVL